MKVIKTTLEDALLIEPKVFGDHRGFFTESYNKETFAAAGIDIDFVQDIIPYQKKQVSCAVCIIN
ncbi:MAG TPA: dTDP-4-dehydrorhamnose 3,5-epimerase family protein [Erysipelothrix sp.]